MKKNVFLIISLISLICLISLMIIQRNTQTRVNSRAAGGTIDTLPYLLGNHSVGSSSDPKSNGITNYVAGNSVFYAKNGSGTQYEYRAWDTNYIYLVQDTSVGGVQVGGVEPNSYKFAPGKGIWMKRQMAVGESIVAVPGITWFKDCQQVGAWPDWSYTVTLEAQKTLNVGGDLKNQNVIVLKYDYGSGFERFFYSKDWGWVRWEEWDTTTNQIKRSGNFNQIQDKLLPIKTSCGTPQPRIPTPTPTPSPSPTSTPAPTPTPTPTPGDQNSCPEPGNPICYDCNHDKTVNILDFSCFSKNYGKKIA